MVENDHAPLDKRAESACRGAEGNLGAPLRLATGDFWEAEHNPPTGSGCDPQHESPDLRRSRAYIERFRERIPLGRAIRLMCDPQHESPDLRRSRAYIERFRERIPLGRAIRLMCGSCMGGEVDQMPRGDVARAIDGCGSCMCPLWPFRFGNDPWRPELSEAKLAAVRRAGEKARRCLEAQRRTGAGSATGHSDGTVSGPSGPETA